MCILHVEGVFASFQLPASLAMNNTVHAPPTVFRKPLEELPHTRPASCRVCGTMRTGRGPFWASDAYSLPPVNIGGIGGSMKKLEYVFLCTLGAVGSRELLQTAFTRDRASTTTANAAAGGVKCMCWGTCGFDSQAFYGSCINEDLVIFFYC